MTVHETPHPAQSEPSGLLALVWPMLRAALWGVTGFAASTAALALSTGQGPLEGVPLTLGYLVGMVGWILGGGAWEHWVRPWFGAPSTWDEGSGTARYWRYHTDHKVIGIQYLVTSGVALFVAGLAAMAMRIELLTPRVDFFADAGQYNAFVGVHGSLMIFAVAVVAIVGGFGNYFVPLVVGADDMPFPFVNGVSWWFVVPGVAAIAASPLLGGIQAGWTGYAPLTSQGPEGQLLYYLGVFSLGISSLLTAINVIGTILYMRAPGMTLMRMPMFAWGMLVTSVLNLLWVPVVGTAMTMGVLDRLVPTAFFNANGLPVAWQDLFWLFGHPEVYIIMLPAWAIWLEILPTFTRKSLFGYGWAVAGFLGVMLLSMYVWNHHMFTATADSRAIPFMSSTELISIPTGFFYLVVLGTLWQGRLRMTTPMILVLFSIFNFLFGGLSGVFLADVPADYALQDTFFVVSHFHYTIVGGMIFAWLAGLHYWFPKYSGRMYHEGLGKATAWLQVIAFNLLFFPMYLAGVMGMNRRIAEYLPYLEGINVLVSIAGFLFGASFLLTLGNLWVSWRRGPIASANPWGAKTMEWQTTSPPPLHNFERQPVLTWDLYEYGEGTPTPESLLALTTVEE